MFGFSRCFFVGLLAISFSSQAVFDGVKNHIRDLTVEALVKSYFLVNSNYIVEVDDKNYPEIDQLVTELSKKASIKKPMTFLITKKVPGFFDKANACATGDKDYSVVFLGSWIVNSMTKAELEGVLAHEITHIAKNHVLKKLAVTGCLLAGCLLASYVIMQAVRSSSFWCNIPTTEYANFKVSVTVNDKIIDVTEKIAAVAENEKFQQLSKFKKFMDSNSSINIPYFGGTVSNLFLTALGLTGIPSLAAVCYYSRKHEKEADLGSVDLNGHKKIAQSLEKLEDIQKKYTPFSVWWSSWWIKRIFATHPQVKDRVKYIEEYVPAQPVLNDVVAA